MSIIFENVDYTYMRGTPYEKKALKGVNIEIKRGEFVGVIGHTGSGKSTFAQHINGLLKPTGGQVLVDGENINAKGRSALLARRKIGLVFQYPEHQLFEETVCADIAFGPRNYGAAEEDVKRRVLEAMKFVGLDYHTYAKRSPFHLSGGQMRRVAIAGVVALNPDYLVLDEPSAGLDPRGRQAILQQIYKLHKDTGMAVIMISHSMEEIASLTDRMIVMRKGAILLDGTPREIFIEDKEKLQLAGVDVPQVVKIANDLIARGFKLERIPLTLEELEKSILQGCKIDDNRKKGGGESC